EDTVELLHHFVVREDLRVGCRQSRQQAALVLAVVKEHDLLAVGAVELAALSAIRHGNLQGKSGCPRRGTIERDASLDEGAEHREESASGAVNRTRVGSVSGDVPILVQQVRPRNADMIEAESAVVDAVQP